MVKWHLQMFSRISCHERWTNIIWENVSHNKGNNISQKPKQIEDRKQCQLAS